MSMKTYYQMSEEEIRQEVNQGSQPLTVDQVRNRQKEYGPNELIEGEKKSLLGIFAEQFRDFLVIILMISAAVSWILGEGESALVILVVITMNAVLGTVQTVKAEQSLSSLKRLCSPSAKVLRDGVVVEIPSREVTVGDEVYLEAGDYIPADGRILENASMKTDESALTGESMGVEKTSERLEGELALGDRKNMVYSGSFVTYGRGSFLVTAVGMQTEVGKIAGLLKTASEKKTPLQMNLDQFGKKLSVIILILCGALFGLQMIRGGELADAFLFAVALAVAAIPEALSSIVTIVLAFGTQKMSKEGAVIRKLQAVEGLGSVSVICSDKTGTLTQNKMTVEHYYVDGQSVKAEELDVENPSHVQLLRMSVLCNDASVTDGQEIGDPTETALVALGEKLGVQAQTIREEYPRLSELPFDSDRKLMSTFHQLQN
ncbi:E1-E2 ATPase, partial [Blautia hydrogenotrophica DSM 10507]